MDPAHLLSLNALSMAAPFLTMSGKAVKLYWGSCQEQYVYLLTHSPGGLAIWKTEHVSDTLKQRKKTRWEWDGLVRCGLVWCWSWWVVLSRFSLCWHCQVQHKVLCRWSFSSETAWVHPHISQTIPYSSFYWKAVLKHFSSQILVILSLK